MAADEVEKGKRLDRGNVEVWEVKEPWIDIQCQLGEGPYYEPKTHSVRFLDVFGKKVYWVDLAKGPSSLRSVDVEDCIGVTADIAGNDSQLLVAAKYGFALLDKDTGKLTYIYRTYNDKHQERMRFNDGAVDPSGRFWAGTMTDNSKYAVKPKEGCVFRLSPKPLTSQPSASPSASQSQPQPQSHTNSNSNPLTSTTNKPQALSSSSPSPRYEVAEETVSLLPALLEVTIPNGIGWPSDKKRMLFTDSPTRTIKEYPYDDATGEIKMLEGKEWFKLEGWVRIPSTNTTSTSSEGVSPSSNPRESNTQYEDFSFPPSSVPDGFQLDSEGNLWSAVWGAGMVIRISDVGGERVITGVVKLPTRCSSCPRFVKGGGMIVTSASEEEVERFGAGGRGEGRVFFADVGVEGGSVWEFGWREV